MHCKGFSLPCFLSKGTKIEALRQNEGFLELFQPACPLEQCILDVLKSQDSHRHSTSAGGEKHNRRDHTLTSAPPGSLMVSCGDLKTCRGWGHSGRALPGATPQMKVRFLDWLTPKLPAFSTPKRTCISKQPRGQSAPLKPSCRSHRLSRPPD